jgi:hypothetical protein
VATTEEISSTSGQAINRSWAISQNQPSRPGTSLTILETTPSVAVGSGANSDTSPRVIADSANRMTSVGLRARSASVAEEKNRMLRSGL